MNQLRMNMPEDVPSAPFLEAHGPPAFVPKHGAQKGS